jgi:selenocysteine-specific elongation factor
MRVIGTAGHVDHGKSALVAALTGIHPDRLKEEKARGMTIDLGFAWMTLPDGEEIGIVDVPGHRDFIGNMLAGVGGIDAVLLVIAADEGIMPQTREHLDILDLLHIQNGIVALTKVDHVDDPAWLDLVEGEIRTLLQGTGLQSAPIMKVSAITQEGMPGLVEALSLLVKNTPARPDLGSPRLPIDRIFSISGFGTVVTGTLVNGCLGTGEEVEILPSGHQGRIRSLQTHKKKETVAYPGSRTAVNITGLNVGQIQRGEVVSLPGKFQPTQRIDLRFRLLPNVSDSIRHHTEVKFFIGTSETVADLRLLGADKLSPGESGWLQLELHSPVVAVRGDRYILRRPSPEETLGGGMVVDPHPIGRHKRYDKGVLQGLTAYEKGSPDEVLYQAALTLGLTHVKDVIILSGLESQVAESSLSGLINSSQIIKLGVGPQSIDDLILAGSHWKELKHSITSALTVYHETYPLRRGMPREELKSRLKLSLQAFNLVMTKMAAEGDLKEGHNWVSLPSYTVQFSPVQKEKVNQLLTRFEAAPFAPPSIKECQAELGEDVLNAMKENELLVFVSDEVAFRKKDYETMVEKIHHLLSQKGQVSLAEIRDMLGTSRKYVQALLEHLDVIGLTFRSGDFRRLKNGDR